MSPLQKEEEGTAASSLLQLSRTAMHIGAVSDNSKKRNSAEVEKITTSISDMTMDTSDAPDFQEISNKRMKIEIEEKSVDKIQTLQQKRSVTVNPKSRHNISPQEIISKLRFLSGAIIRRDSENLSVNDALDRFRRTLVRFFTSYSFQQGVDGAAYKFKVKYQRNTININENAHRLRIRVMAKKAEYELLTGALKDTIISAIQTVGESIIKTYVREDNNLSWDIDVIDETKV